MVRLHREIPLSGESAFIEGDEARYLSRVLRLIPGDRVAFFWGDGNDHIYEIESYGRSNVSLRYLSSEKNPADPQLEITLIQGQPKSSKLDDIIRSVTALGVGRIIPFDAYRSIGKGDPHKTARWNKIAAEASRQCGRTRVPEVLNPSKDLPAALKSCLTSPGVVCWEEARQPIRDVLKSFSGASSFTLVCGPEGGLTAEEVETARNAGLEPVSLGPRILRAELAPCAAVSIVQHVLGDMG